MGGTETVLCWGNSLKEGLRHATQRRAFVLVLQLKVMHTEKLIFGGGTWMRRRKVMALGTRPQAVAEEWWTVYGARDADTDRNGPRFMSWFVDGRQNPVCRDPRTFRPGRVLNPLEWLDLLCRIWHDRCDRHDRLSVHLVQPAPPNDGEDTYVHVIVSQKPREGFRPILISYKFDISQPWQHVAFMARRFVNRFALLTLVDLAPMCFGGRAQRVCHVWHREILLGRTGESMTEAGDGVRILVENPPTSLASHPGVADSTVVPMITPDGIETLTVAYRAAFQLHHAEVAPVHTWFVNHQDALICRESRLASQTRT